MHSVSRSVGPAALFFLAMGFAALALSRSVEAIPSFSPWGALAVSGWGAVFWLAFRQAGLARHIRSTVREAETIAACAPLPLSGRPEAWLDRIAIMMRLSKAKEDDKTSEADIILESKAEASAAIQSPDVAETAPSAPEPVLAAPVLEVTGDTTAPPDPIGPHLAEVLRLMASGQLLGAQAAAKEVPAGPEQEAAVLAVSQLAARQVELLHLSEKASQALRRLSAAGNGLALSAGRMTASLEKAADLMSEQIDTAAETVKTGEAAYQAVDAAAQQAARSTTILQSTSRTMNGIKASGERIAAFVEIIDSIAFQTNLLALNAGVEAARAGQDGRGFAVVAAEVRALAGRASDAAREIGELIEDSASEVDQGVNLVSQSENALQEIVQTIARAGRAVQDLMQSSTRQQKQLGSVAGSLSDDRRQLQGCSKDLQELESGAKDLQHHLQGIVKPNHPIEMEGAAETHPVSAPEPVVKDETSTVRTPNVAPAIQHAVAGEWQDF